MGMPNGRRKSSWVLLALALASVSCMTLEPHPSSPAPSQPQTATRATLQLSATELADGRFVGLAFSGGGSRAALFGAAVMKELDRVGLLSQVDVLSAVSGGALPAASYALDGYRDLSFQNGFLEQIGRDFQAAVLGPWYMAPPNAFRLLLTKTIAADRVIRALDDGLFHGATYRDLNPSRPILLLNSTDALTGDPLVISQERFAELGQPLAPFSIARAVYMSAAYPDVLEPLALDRGGPGLNGSAPPPLLAYDGGAADNLGIRTLMQVLDVASTQRPWQELFPRGCLVLSIDATGRKQNEARRPLSAAAVLLKSHRRDLLELAGIPASDQDVARFGRFPVGRNGDGDSCDFWHLALRQLPDSDPLGKQVTQIKTNLGLSAEEQAALTEAAARLVANGLAELRTRNGLAKFLEGRPMVQSQP